MLIKMSKGLGHGEPVEAQHPWPEDVFIQGGTGGLVLGNPSYRTAFVEVFHESFRFVRGEGETWQEAEDACWAKVQKHLACGEHEYEPRQYKNGGGVCKKCGSFHGDVFTPEQLGLFCAACGIPTFWHSEHRDEVEEFFLCESHTPHVTLPDGSYTLMCGCPRCREERPARMHFSVEDLDAIFTPNN